MSTPRFRRIGFGVWALAVALVGLVVLTFLPTGYVIQSPGSVYNTLGEVEASDGSVVPLISIEGAEVYETEGALRLTTVQVSGNRENPLSWAQLALAWIDPSRAVVPVDAVFPEGTTAEEREEQNAVLMTDSQQEATAAALTELGYDLGTQVQVVDIAEDAAAQGVLQQGDVILSAYGVTQTSATVLRELIQERQGAPVDLVIERDGQEQGLTITPKKTSTEDGADAWVIGVTLQAQYDFPIDVKIQLDNVGGPSAGMMFALGIIDDLTPGSLTGGEDVAGTGTITADGAVGAIGGIRQKLYGARDAGADYFLAPASNCDEVTGHIPDGLQVIATSTLEESLAALDVIAADGDIDSLPSCSTASP